MADKFRGVAPLDITFAPAEQPSPEKLTAVARQGRTGIGMLEKAVGDLWNQSGDPIMRNFPLQIPNLARLVGEGKYLNPALFPTIGDFVYEDNVGNKFTGRSDIHLQFKPKAGSTFSWSAQYTTERSDAQLVTSATDYWVDDNTGRAVLGSALTANTAVTYTVDPTDWSLGEETLPGVIPDPRQTDFVGCRISESGGTYYLHFPPRAPLTFPNSWERPERYPDSLDYGGGVDDNYDATVQTNKRLWQDPSVSALPHAHYRYALPKDLQEQWASISIGDALPTGFVYVWDRASEQVVADAVLKKTSDSWIFIIESSTLDLDSYVSTDESESSYNSTLLSIITAGAPISRVLWTLSNSLYNHKHGNEGDFSPVMEHSHLAFLNPPTETYASHYGSYPVSGVEWGKSSWAGDDHVSLLSRGGSHGTAANWHRDPLDNAMLGDLVLADRTRTLDADCAAGSFSLCFGAQTGPSLQGVTKAVKVNDFLSLAMQSVAPVDGDNDDLAITSSLVKLGTGPSGAFYITGVAGPTTSGSLLLIWNKTGYDCRFKSLDAGSTAGNRIYEESDLKIDDGYFALLFYDESQDSGNGAWVVANFGMNADT